MSHIEQIDAYDHSLLESLVRAHRQGDAEVLLSLITASPSTDSREMAQARKKLADYEKKNAPQLLITEARRQADPQGFLRSLIEAGETPDLWTVVDLARREQIAIDDAFHHAAWVCDPQSWDIVEESETWPFIEGSPSNPAVREMFFGSSEPAVDGVFVESFRLNHRPAQVRVYHRPDDLERVIGFLDDARTKMPPDLALFRRWYRKLFAFRYSLSDDMSLPDEGVLAWHYALFLANVHRLLRRLSMFYRRCRHRKWGCHVLIE